MFTIRKSVSWIQTPQQTPSFGMCLYHSFLKALLRLQIIFNEPHYKIANGFIKKNDDYFLKCLYEFPQSYSKDTKKKKFSQNQLKLDCLSFHATGKTGLKKNIIGSSHLYLGLDKWPELTNIKTGTQRRAENT